MATSSPNDAAEAKSHDKQPEELRDRLLKQLEEWVRAGGTAVVLFRGSLESEWLRRLGLRSETTVGSTFIVEGPLARGRRTLTWAVERTWEPERAWTPKASVKGLLQLEQPTLQILAEDEGGLAPPARARAVLWTGSDEERAILGVEVPGGKGAHGAGGWRTLPRQRAARDCRRRPAGERLDSDVWRTSLRRTLSWLVARRRCLPSSGPLELAAPGSQRDSAAGAVVVEPTGHACARAAPAVGAGSELGSLRRLACRAVPQARKPLRGGAIHGVPQSLGAPARQIRSSPAVASAPERGCAPLGPHFTVFATQNPVEQEGTYRLPEAELDRFLFRIDMGYPSEADELTMLRSHHSGDPDPRAAQALFRPEDWAQARRIVSQIQVVDEVLKYALALVRATRDDANLAVGGSPRAALWLVRAAKAIAALAGRDYALAEDIQEAWRPVFRHRVTLEPAAEVDGMTSDEALEQVLARVAVPH